MEDNRGNGNELWGSTEDRKFLNQISYSQIFQGESNPSDYPCVIVSHFQGNLIYNIENQ
jgi:hypothetical protein